VLYSKDGIFDGTVAPSRTNAGALGSSSVRWGDIYGASIDAQGQLISRYDSGKKKFEVTSAGKLAVYDSNESEKLSIDATGLIKTSGTIECREGLEVKNAAGNGVLFSVGTDASGAITRTFASHANYFFGDYVEGVEVYLATNSLYNSDGTRVLLKPSLCAGPAHPNCFWACTATVDPGWTNIKAVVPPAFSGRIKSVILTAKSVNGRTPGSDDKNSENKPNETNYANKWFADWNKDGYDVYIYNGLSQTGTACVLIAANI
jgi:hypothetical protein